MNTINSINPKNVDSSKYFLMTIDVEDWFQVENFKPWIPFETWKQRELRVERNVHRLLDLFDSIKLFDHKSNAPNLANTTNTRVGAFQSTSTPKATFFLLGWVAESLPNLVAHIAERGHEVASHGYNHVLLTKMPVSVLKKDLTDSRNLLEDIVGKPVTGFRAPSFSINDRLLSAVAETGFRYDSSYNSFSLNRRYGRLSFNGHPKIGIAHRMSDDFYELPISNLNLFGTVLPLGGGSYFRLLPFSLFKKGVSAIIEKDYAYLFYMHPWEIDPGQPRVKEASLDLKLRHYTNIHKTYKRLASLLSDFAKCRYVTCSEYLDLHESSDLSV